MDLTLMTLFTKWLALKEKENNNNDEEKEEETLPEVELYQRSSWYISKVLKLKFNQKKWK